MNKSIFEAHIQAAKDYADAAVAHAQKELVGCARNASDPEAFSKMLTSEDPAILDGLYESLGASVQLPELAKTQIELAKNAFSRSSDEQKQTVEAVLDAAETYVEMKLQLAAALNNEGAVFVMKFFSKGPSR